MKRCTSSICLRILSAALCVLLLSPPAWAAPVTTGTGSAEDPTKTVSVTTSVTTDPATQVTTTETTQDTKWEGTTTDGGKTTSVSGQEAETSTQVQDSTGFTTLTSGSCSGEEKTSARNTETQETTDTASSAPVTMRGQESVVTSDTGTYEMVPDSKTTDEPSTESIPLADSYPVTISLQPGEEKTSSFPIDYAKLLAIPASSSTTEVTTIRDAEDNIIGYTATTRSEDETLDPATIQEQREEYSDEECGSTAIAGETSSVTEVKITLPERPAESRTVEANGDVTVVSVSEIFQDGKLVGYCATKAITDSNGKLRACTRNSVWGTKTTTTTKRSPSTETSTTKEKVVTTQTVLFTQGVDIAGKKISATPGELTASMGAILAGSSDGKTSMQSIRPQNPPRENQFDRERELYGRSKDQLVYTPYGSWPYLWKGESGLESMIRVRGEDEDTWRAQQFILRDQKGNAHYVYCADFDVSAKAGWRYQMENLEDASYYDKTAAQHIRAIALHGYWGTEAGIGSLGALKETLKKDNSCGLTEREIVSLTDGEALTATQAAIWNFANSGEEKIDSRDIVGRYYDGKAHWQNKPYENPLVQKLYQYLISLSEAPAEQSTILNQGQIQGASITIKGEDTADYVSDLSFFLGIKPDNRTSNLLAELTTASGDKIFSEAISGAGEDNVVPTQENDSQWCYTFSGLRIPKGAALTLRILGNQNLGQGVYLYSSESRNGVSAQTFLGIAEGERTVDLSVPLSFSLTPPAATLETFGEHYTQCKNETQTRSRIDTTTQEHSTIRVQTEIVSEDQSLRQWESSWQTEYTEDPQPQPDPQPRPQPEHDPKPLPDPEPTPQPEPDPQPEIDVPEDPVPLTPAEPEPEVPEAEPPQAPETERPEADIPLSPAPEKPLPASPVPCTDVPRTGDPAAAYALTAALSASGLLLLFILSPRKRFRKER